MDFKTPTRRVRKSLKTDDEQLAIVLLEKEKKKEVERDYGLDTKDIGTEQFVKRYMDYAATRKAAQTLEFDKLRLDRFFDYVKKSRLSQIRVVDINEYCAWRLSDAGGGNGHAVSKDTLKRDLTTLRHAFNWAVRSGYLERNPFDKVEKIRSDSKGKQIEYLKIDERDKLLDTARETNSYLCPMIAVAAYTGMRQAEIINLRWEDIDFERRELIVRNRKEHRTKDREDRIIPIHEKLFAILQEIQNDKEEGPIFQTSTGHLHMRSNILRDLKLLAKKAGIKRITWNILRHSFASHLVMKNVSLYKVSKLLGHASVRITEQHYAALAPNRLREEVNLL
jgi:site-specific recombinase XerD